MSRKKVLWIIAALLVALAGFRIATLKKPVKTAETASGKPVYVLAVGRGSMQSAIKASGNIFALQQAEIYSRVPGKLIRNLVEEGSPVEENQDVALIDRDEIGVDFSTATARSTLKGILLQHYLDPGAKVNPAMPVASVGNITRVKAVVNLAENDFSRVRRGTRVLISVDAYPEQKFPGEISTLSPQIDMMSRTGKAEIVLDNRDGRFKPGMFASVEFILASHPGVIIVPRNSVLEDGDSRKVFVVADGKAYEKTVQAGLYDDDNVEILSGLRDKEQLITEGQRTLKNGEAVRIVER